jgi:WD40 repeat protein
MSPEHCADCPPPDELDRLIRGRLSAARTTDLTEHVGNCTECQQRMEELASGGGPGVADALREADRARPASDSRFWSALSAAEAEVTATAVLPPAARSDEWPAGELKLDFLRPPTAPDRLGRLGAFDVVRVVGRGGMGVVLHGYDPHLQRDVALKVIDPQLAGNEVARKRFCREARAAAAVTHDNLVAVHQVDEDEDSGLPYLVMQLVNGESLDQRLKRVGTLSAVEVARLGMQAAAGLAAAHAGGLIHRDIKPGNILLEAGTDRVKLTDFGLAKAAEDVRLTRTGFVAGSPLYMAPEQARGDEVDHRADLFSLGSVLYEAAAGKPPFDAKTPLAVLRRVADETPPPLREVDPHIPDWLSDVIDRLLAKDPADRPQSAAEVAEEFAAGLARMHSLSPLDVPAEVCAGSRTAVSARPRRHVCWKAVAFRVLPWVGGAVLGGLLVGLWPRAAAPDPAADTGPQPLVVLSEGKAGPVWATGFLPDGKTLVAGAEDGSLRLWDWRAADVTGRPPPLEGNVWSVDVSPDGRYLIAACDDSAVKVYDLKTSGVRWSLPHPTATRAAVFSPDGERVATGDRNSTVRLWNPAEGIPTELPGGHRGTVHGLAFGPTGKLLASAGSDGTVKVWDLQTTRVMQNLDEQAGPVYAVAFSPDPDRPVVAAAGWDGAVRVWDARSGRKLHTLRGHDGDVWSVSFGAGGRVLASAGSDSTVRVWDVDAGRELHVLRGPNPRPFHTVRFDRDGITLAAGGRDGAVRVWEIR